MPSLSQRFCLSKYFDIRRKEYNRWRLKRCTICRGDNNIDQTLNMGSYAFSVAVRFKSYWCVLSKYFIKLINIASEVMAVVF